MKAIEKNNYEETDKEGYAIITKENNLDFFKILISKLNSNPYKNNRWNICKNLEGKEDIFEELNLDRQCFVINQIICWINTTTQALLLQSYIEEVQCGDSTNREGHAAKVYFNALFGKDFTRTSDCNINAALNYGYSIVLSSFTREIAANGYITQLGLFHDNMFNPFNLASDLMEPFRPLVDQVVYNMELCSLEKSEKMELVNILNQTVYVNERTEYVNNAVKIYCKSIFDALNDKDVALIKFYYL